jgi:hypothetical protein
MIAEVLLIKDENRYLLEHLAYNAAAGVEHFFIYDNMSRVPVADFLRENASEFLNICTVARYQGRDNLQLDCYNDYVQQHRHIDWTVFCDTDEILTGNIRDTVVEFGSDYNCLSFSPILHGCNGKINDDGGGMFERFGNDVADPAHHWYKFVARTADIVSIPNPHCNVMSDKRLKYLTAANYPQCTLHHFRYRSFEEWITKIQRGTCLCLSEKDRHKMAEFFDANPTISPADAEVVALMQRYGVDVNFEQKYNN